MPPLHSTACWASAPHSTATSRSLQHPQPALTCGRERRWRRQRRALAVHAGELPVVDWQRSQVQQCLFIDRSDTVRARFAAGMLERIVAWRGCSRIIVGYSAGVEAAPGSRLEWSTQAALFGIAAGWQLRPHLFTAAKQQFEPDDVDKFELLICLDSGIQAAVLKQLSAARPAQPASYAPRICCLTDFLMYCPDEVLLGTGSAGLLDRQLRGAVQLALPTLRPSAARIAAAAAARGGSSGGSTSSGGEALQGVAVPAYMLPSGIPRPPLRAGSFDAEGGGLGGSADEQWERMALLSAVCCAGLVQYLLDCYPLSEDSGMED